MKIKDENGKTIAEINLESGVSVKDLIKSLSGTKSKSSFQNLVSIEESVDKKQIVFNFSDGRIFYDLPKKVFLKENGVKIGQTSFRYIKPNLNNKEYIFRHPIRGYSYERNNFWDKLSNKTTSPWIKTFFNIIDIWANKLPIHMSKAQVLRRNKLEVLSEDKSFFDCVESFAKIPKIQSLDEKHLIELYDSLASLKENSEKISISFNECEIDNWLLSRFEESPSEVYFPNEKTTLKSYIGDYAFCVQNGLKEFFKYVFDNHRGIILNGQVLKIKDLINFGYEPNRLMDYLYRDIYNQGLELNLETKWNRDFGALTTLYDYAKMNIDMKKDYEKYPRYLSTFHDITQKNYELEEDKILSKKFQARVKELKKINFEYSDDSYKIIIPKNSKDLIKEGQDLSHCVASYYKRMALGETNVVFLRKVNELNESLVTIEIDNNKNITQAKGKNNSSPQEKEKEFINKYKLFLLKK